MGLYISSRLCEACKRNGELNFKGVFALRCAASDDLSFASVEIDRDFSSNLPRWKSLCHRGSGNQPQPGSFFQRPREAEEREPRNEVGTRNDVSQSVVLFPVPLALPTDFFCEVIHFMTSVSRRS